MSPIQDYRDRDRRRYDLRNDAGFAQACIGAGLVIIVLFGSAWYPIGAPAEATMSAQTYDCIKPGEATNGSLRFCRCENAQGRPYTMRMNKAQKCPVSVRVRP